MAKVIGIVGTRRRDDAAAFKLVRSAFLRVYEPGDEIVSGGCYAGGDRFAEVIAKKEQVTIKIYYAPWNRKHGGAGYWRNTFIARDADILIACVASDRTGGTEDTIRKFKEFHPDGRLILV